MTHWRKPRPGIGLTGPLVAIAFVLAVIGLARCAHAEIGLSPDDAGGYAVLIQNFQTEGSWVHCDGDEKPRATVTQHPTERGKYRVLLECPQHPEKGAPTS